MGLLAAVVMAGVVTGLLSQGGAAPRQVVRFRLDLGPGLRVDPAAAAFAWAPDGSRLVVVARDAAGRSRLVVRALDTLAPFAIPGTEGAAAPFFSPDGRFIAFFAEGAIKRTRAAPESPLVLAPAPAALGGVWLADGTIVFGGGESPGLSRVRAEGGPVQRLTAPAFAEGEVRHAWPAAIARDRFLVYTAIAADERLASARVLVSDASGLARRVLVEGAAFARPAKPAHLVLLRPGGLFGMPFDDGAGTITGPERLLEASPAVDPRRAAAQVAISDRGALALVPRRAPGEPLDPQAGVRVPDGIHEVIAQRLDGPFNLVKRPVGGDGPVLRLTSSPHNQRPLAIGPDGRTLVFAEVDSRGAITRWSVDLDGHRAPERLPDASDAVLPPHAFDAGPALDVTLDWSAELARHVPIRPRDVRTVR
jgi:hypothetical protein